MKYKNNRFNKGVALVLSATLALALSASLPIIDMSARAASITAPSITAYATKAELKTKFTPNDAGTQAIGKLAFGKDGLEWYILGQDSGTNVKNDNGGTVSDNTVIFPTKVLNICKDYDDNMTKLQDYMNSYISTTESCLLLNTTVKYRDKYDITRDRAKRNYYTGKFYLLDSTDAEGNISGVPWEYITAGSDDSIKVPVDPYWLNCECNFWLRSCFFSYAYGRHGAKA